MGRTLRILSANLQNDSADPDGVAALVRREDPDVLCVQELGPEQASALADVLPHGRLEPGTDHHGQGILLRCPTRVTTLSLTRRDARVAVLQPDDWHDLAEPLEIVNVHVVSPLAPPIVTMPAIRGAQLRQVLAHVTASPVRRRALIGDFNATPVWPVYRGMVAHFDDAVLRHARARGRRPRRTWPSWSWLPGVRMLRIDHCFTEGLVAADVATLDIPGSDHDALRVDLDLA